MQPGAQFCGIFATFFLHVS